MDVEMLEGAMARANVEDFESLGWDFRSTEFSGETLQFSKERGYLEK